MAHDPHLTDIGLAFQLLCASGERTFVISREALDILGRRHGYAMSYLNLYYAHEAIIHVVARFLAHEEKSALPILIDAPHFHACETTPLPAHRPLRARMAA